MALHDEAKYEIEHAERGSVHDVAPAHAHAHGHGDKALELIGDERVELSQEDNDRIRRKTDRYILSVLVWVYFLQILDKSALGYAATWGLSTDAHLVGNQYSLISTMNAIAQLGWQPFSSYLIVRIPARHLMAGLCLGWGIAQACMAASDSFGALVATRFLLGLFEAGCLPLFGHLTSIWWRRSEQPMRVAAWYCTNGFATCATQKMSKDSERMVADKDRAAIISYGLGHVKSEHIKPWQLIFLVVGVLTVVSAPIVWLLIDSDVTTARFLDADDKAKAIERLRANQTGTGSNEFKWDHVVELFTDVKSYLWVAMALLLNIGASVTNAFGPTLINGLGFSTYISTLLNMPFGVLQVICILAASYAAQKWRIKSAVLALFVVPVIIGLAVLFAEGMSSHYKQGAALTGYYLLAFLFGGNPLIVAWCISNTGGTTKRSLTLSAYNAGSSAGNIIGPLLFNARDKPHYIPGVRAVLGIFCGLLGVIALQCAALATLNKVRQRQRVAAGKPKFINDTSMDEAYVAYGGDEANGVQLGQNALLDLTDYKNDEFVYVY